MTPATESPTSAPFFAAEVRAGVRLRGDLTACVGDDDASSPRCGHSGTASQVRRAVPVDAVLDLLERYVRAMSSRSPDALRPLLDDTLGTTTNPTPREGMGFSREVVVSLHERLFDMMDARGFVALGLRVLSYDACRVMHCNAWLRPGDWYVEWRPASLRAAVMPGFGVAPSRMVVRWRDGVPRIAALNEEFFGRIGR